MLLEIARKRKTVRKFSSDEIDLADVLYCIDVAREAPSGMNAQPWRFVIIDDEETKAKIKEVCEKGEKKFYRKVDGELKKWLKERIFTWSKNFLNASILLLVFSHKKAPYFIQSTWLAIGYLLLALEEKGLATVTYTPPNPVEIGKLVNAPSEYKLQVILPIGYSADDKEKESRKEIQEIAYINEWGKQLRP